MCFYFSQSKLFEGLEEESGLSPDTFVPRKNIKKLVIKSKSITEVRQDLKSNKILQYSVHARRCSGVVVSELDLSSEGLWLEAWSRQSC